MPDLERSAVAAAPGASPRERTFRHQIEEGVSIAGRIHFPGDARIDGQLKGEIRADQLLVIGPTAELQANVSARRMVLAGTLQGDIVQSGTVELEPTARLLGNVEARNLIVQAGAFFDGRASIGKPAESAKPKTTSERPPAPAQKTRKRANG